MIGEVSCLIILEEELIGKPEPYLRRELNIPDSLDKYEFGSTEDNIYFVRFYRDE